MMLLVDAGNSRIKWRLVAKRVLLDSGVAPTADVAALEAKWCRYKPSEAVLSCVAGEAVRICLSEMLARHGISVFWLKPERENFGILNRYDNPEQLGADRYAALIAAARLKLGHCVVVSVGTATTVDMLNQANEFLGGVIIPGPDLMLTALLNATGQIEPLMRGDTPGHSQVEPGFTVAPLPPWPRNTGHAVTMGIEFAQFGVVRALCERLPRLPGQALSVIVTGGARARLHAGSIQYLSGGESVQWMEIDDLVLDGLAWVALEREKLTAD